MSEPNALEKVTLVNLHEMFEKRFGQGWYELEEETLSLELNVVFSDRFLQKVRLLKVLLNDSHSFEHKLEKYDSGDTGWLGIDEPRISSDVLFFLHSCEIINNELVEPAVIIMPEVLQLAFAIVSLQKLPISFKPEESSAVKFVCEHVLKKEGIDRPVAPFTFLDASVFSGTKHDSYGTEVESVINNYIASMEKAA